MKKNFILLSLLISSQFSFGQLNQANEPAVGASSPMYLITDTSTVTMASILSIVGTNVEWDYSAVTMETSPSETIGVVDPASTSSAADFPTSTKAISQGTIVQYYNSTATERVSQGFVFNEPTIGEVVIVFDTDEATVLTYPFDYGSTNADAYDGSTELTIGMPTTADVLGTIYSEIDGTGTLKLPGNTLIGNVFRLVTKDTSTVSDGGFVNTTVIRTQMEYYDATNPELPIFVDAYISVEGFGAERQVLSKDYTTAGIEAKKAISNLILYPNPSKGTFTVSGDFHQAGVEVMDLTGKIVFESTIENGGGIELNNARNGVYFLRLTSDAGTSIQKITIK